MSKYGKPSNDTFVMNQEAFYTPLSGGGLARVFQAHQSLKYGDAVYLNPISQRADKSLEASLYPAFFLGYVCGGTATYMEAAVDAGLVGVTMSAAGENVLVQVSGIAIAANDSTGTILAGQPVSAGTTTAGRVVSGQVYSAANNNPALAIKAGGSAVVKSVNAFSTISAGVNGTSTAANLDAAALSGTVTNGQYGIYVFRVASNGTTVTSAASTATTQNGIAWPTAGASNLITYGCVLINPTGTGDFVGGTTALDDATVIPNAKYFNIVRRRFDLGIALETVTGTAGAAFKVLL